MDRSVFLSILAMDVYHRNEVSKGATAAFDVGSDTLGTATLEGPYEQTPGTILASIPGRP